MNTDQLPLPEPQDPLFGRVIYAYTRAQAIEDGVLVDVSETGQQVGFKFPVAITEALLGRLTPTRADQSLGQDYEGRLWDVLWLAAFTGRLADRGEDTMNFTVVLQEVNAQSGKPQNTDLRLWAVCGPGDNAEPVVTIGFPADF